MKTPPLSLISKAQAHTVKQQYPLSIDFMKKGRRWVQKSFLPTFAFTGFLILANKHESLHIIYRNVVPTFNGQAWEQKIDEFCIMLYWGRLAPDVVTFTAASDVEALLSQIWTKRQEKQGVDPPPSLFIFFFFLHVYLFRRSEECGRVKIIYE